MTRRIAAAAILWITLAGGAQAQMPAPRGSDREISHVRGDLYLVRDGREHTIFLVTSDGIVIGDPLSITAARWLKAELESRCPGVPIRFVLVTQHHYARAEGVGVFTGAPESVAQARYNNALNRARDKFDAGLGSLDGNDDGALDERELAGAADRAALSERDRNGDRKVTPGELYLRVSDVESHFDRDWKVALGGRVVEMVHVGSTEAPEMSVIVFPSERVVFASGVPPLTLQNGFDNYAPRDAQAWARAVDALTFDTLLTSDGRSVSHADITAFSRYVATLLDVVANGHEAGRSAANLQASATLDAFRDTPFFSGRRAQIDAAYADLRLTDVDLYGAAMGRITWPNATFCAGYADCDETTRVGGATVGLRTTVSRFGVIAEAMFGVRQRESARGTTWSFEHMVHRDTRGSLLASFGSRSRGFSMAVVGGASMTVTDTSGLAVMRGVVAPAGGARRPIASRVNQLGITVGADVTIPMGRRFALTVPVRATQNTKATGDVGVESRDVQMGVGLSLRLSSRVRRR
jgi:hypothetical protein